MWHSLGVEVLLSLPVLVAATVADEITPFPVILPLGIAGIVLLAVHVDRATKHLRDPAITAGT